MPSNILKSVCEHFSMNNMPFIQRSKLAFTTEDFDRNISIVSSAFYMRQFIVISGVSGSGKTSLINYAINALDPTAFRVCHIELSNPNKKAIYKSLAVKMGLSPAFNADDIRLQLINFFSEENEQGKFNCMIIDEAHSLSIPIIDELRSFFDEGSNFSLILSGLPSLLAKTLNLSVNLPMKQRINTVVETTALSLAQTKDYILHQLDLVRAKNEVIDDKCFPLIYNITAGTPRRVNQLCFQALVNSYFAKQSFISAEVIEATVDKMPHIFEKNKSYEV